MSNDTNSKKKIQVVLVDDSGVIRGALSRILSDDPQIEIAGSVSNGQMGVTLARDKQPDIIILDVEMPVMDGLTALPQILRVSPNTKVIMCSSLTEKGADVTIKALALGAVECIVKPSSSQDTGPNSLFQRTLINLIKTLAQARNIQQPTFAPPPRSGAAPSSVPVTPSQAHVTQKESISPTPVTSTALTTRRSSNFTLHDDRAAYKGKPAIIAIGSSTGGPNALFNVLKHLKKLDMPIVITQHMPATFTKILAEHIANNSGIPAHEAADDMIVEKGHIYVAQGAKHMIFKMENNQLKIKLDDGPQENFCKPAVDPMMRSLIDIYGQKVLGVILTGMGHDGMRGCKMLVDKGGRVIAQDEATSAVWGMPGAVATNGLCSAVLPLDQIGPWIARAASGI